MDRVFVLKYSAGDNSEPEIEVYASAVGCAERMLELDNGESEDNLERDHLIKLLDEGVSVFMQDGEIVDENYIDASEAKLWLHAFVQKVNP